ncbi:MAG: hypothetical protein CMM60_08025 [Rhodospirillaceae bacterium]|nr:hypothetical protein [Rhodospirillaceae bacterium]
MHLAKLSVSGLGLFAARQAFPFLNWISWVNGKTLRADILAAMTGAEPLAEEAAKWRDRGGYLDMIGRENVFLSKKQAIPAIKRRLDAERCKACSLHIFTECNDT